MSFDRITCEPGKMNGQPCIRGMRLTVRRVLRAVALYPDRAELFREYPELEEDDIRQALEFAALRWTAPVPNSATVSVPTAENAEVKRGCRSPAAPALLASALSAVRRGPETISRPRHGNCIRGGPTLMSGSRTVSIPWITPLVASRLGSTTCASPRTSVPFMLRIGRIVPSTVSR